MAADAAEVKRLRDATGAGFMDCKRALEEADGDFDKAIEILRVKQGAKVAKRGSEREATNGLVAAAEGAMIALNSETDFVAKNEEFQALAADIVALAAASRSADVEALSAATLSDGRTVSTAIEQTAAAIGEKLELGQVVVYDGRTTTYLHRRATDLPPQIGVLVQFEGDDAETARGIAMQVATFNPPYLTRDEVPADVVDTEKRVAEAKAREEGKPEQALPKIIEGSVNGYYANNVLIEQKYVRDNKKTVKAVLDEAGVTITKFVRFAVGG
ncbi:MAG TPA: translation elongation factor Ts [Mycobacteriales bacterium]|jgi:elongation factor Ts|nr:translation elongation factor Ts [Mycobacteriales bacterium]